MDEANIDQRPIHRASLFAKESFGVKQKTSKRTDLLRVREELLKWKDLIGPTREKHWFRTINQSLLGVQSVDAIWPKYGNEFYNCMCTVNDAIMRAIIDDKLKGSWF